MTTSFTDMLAKRLRLGAQSDPVRDWLMLLMLAFIALVGIVAWNAWAFDTIAQGGVINSESAGAPPVVSRTSLEEVRSIFETRAAEEEKYRTGAYAFSDPSL